MSMEGGMNGMSGIGMSMFNVAESLPILYKLTFSVIIILTISNTLVVKIVEGGGNYKLFFYGGLMSGISGICMILIPPVVSRLFTFEI
jgi:flagellar protein FlaJ